MAISWSVLITIALSHFCIEISPSPLKSTFGIDANIEELKSRMNRFLDNTRENRRRFHTKGKRASKIMNRICVSSNIEKVISGRNYDEDIAQFAVYTTYLEKIYHLVMAASSLKEFYRHVLDDVDDGKVVVSQLEKCQMISRRTVDVDLKIHRRTCGGTGGGVKLQWMMWRVYKTLRKAIKRVRGKMVSSMIC